MNLAVRIVIVIAIFCMFIVSFDQSVDSNYSDDVHYAKLDLYDLKPGTVDPKSKAAIYMYNLT